MSQAACLASCNGVNVTIAHHGQFAFEDFRQLVLDTTASDTEHLIASYSRKLFQQTGDGHFSPIGGYHPGRELVLILDVARFKYPPHWVPLRLLHDAMAPLDTATGAMHAVGSGTGAGYVKLRSNALSTGLQYRILASNCWCCCIHLQSVQ